HRWTEIRVGLGNAGFVEVPVPAAPAIARAAADVAAGAAIPDRARLPVTTATADWLSACGHALRRGFLVVIDFADEPASLGTPGQAQWVRTSRGPQRGEHPLADPGAQDITCDVAVEHLVTHARRAGFRLLETPTQAEWLAGLRIEELTTDARAVWRDRA